MRSDQKPNRKALSELEHVVMDYLWVRGPANSEQVREGLASRRPMKDATVRTILRRMEQKGYVTHRVDGRTYIYSGAERPQNVAVSAVRQIIDRFCSGSVEQLLVGMVDQEVVSRRELESLAKKIAQRKDRKGS
jgi:BlaI family transcriptional regulator, penicillinase repressor